MTKIDNIMEPAESQLPTNNLNGKVKDLPTTIKTGVNPDIKVRKTELNSFPK